VKAEDTATELHKLNEALQAGTLEITAAAAVDMKSVEWLWQNRLALGKLGIFAGLPDVGKGQILCFIAGRITSKDSKYWPCGEGVAPDGSVILLTAEDDPSDTVVPRLAAAGADLSRVKIVRMVRGIKGDRRMFSLVTDLELLRRAITDSGNVVAVMIDPISAYLGHGKVDSFRTTDVRAVLAPLCDMAAELKVAVIAVMHFNKKVDITNALLRISDSLAFGAAARHVYGVVADPDDATRRIVVRAKNNLSPASSDGALAYKFHERWVAEDSGVDITAPYIEFESEYVDISATEAMEAAVNNRSPVQRRDAEDFLRLLLADGPVEARQIFQEAEDNRVAERTLNRAKNGVVDTAKGKGAFKGKWYWRLLGANHPWPWDAA
jgi:AAA domain